MKVLCHPYCAIIGILQKPTLSYVSKTCSLKYQDAQKCMALNRTHPLWLRNRCLLPPAFWGMCFKNHLVTFGLSTLNSFTRQIIVLDKSRRIVAFFPCSFHRKFPSSMPKCKPSKSCYLNKLVSEFGENVFSTDGIIFFCKLCQTKVAAEKRFAILQHSGREKHVRVAKVAEAKLCRPNFYFLKVLHRQVFFKYAPITSVDVERSFSRYKNLYSDNRRSFTFDSIKNHLIIQYNSM